MPAGYSQCLRPQFGRHFATEEDVCRNRAVNILLLCTPSFLARGRYLGRTDTVAHLSPTSHSNTRRSGARAAARARCDGVHPSRRGRGQAAVRARGRGRGRLPAHRRRRCDRAAALAARIPGASPSASRHRRTRNIHRRNESQLLRGDRTDSTRRGGHHRIPRPAHRRPARIAQAARRAAGAACGIGRAAADGRRRADVVDRRALRPARRRRMGRVHRLRRGGRAAHRGPRRTRARHGLRWRPCAAFPCGARRFDAVESGAAGRYRHCRGVLVAGAARHRTDRAAAHRGAGVRGVDEFAARGRRGGRARAAG